jgi:hypothetical protein
MDISLVWRWATGWMIGGSNPGRGLEFFSSPRAQTGSEAHPASYSMGTRGSFPGVKRPCCEAKHSPPSNTKVKKAWGYTSNSPIRLHGVVLNLRIAQGQLYVYLYSTYPWSLKYGRARDPTMPFTRRMKCETTCCIILLSKLAMCAE